MTESNATSSSFGQQNSLVLEEENDDPLKGGMHMTFRLQWEDRYQELFRYKMKFGTCRVSQKKGECKSLCRWVVNQRRRRRADQRHKNKARPLSNYEIQKAGCDWL